MNHVDRSEDEAHRAGNNRSAAQAFIENTFRRLECEHIAALLQSPDQLPPVLAAFLELGAARNGFLVHGSLPGEAGVDRVQLEKAGLDVSGLTDRGQLDIMELDLTLTPEEWVRPWSRLLDERMEAGFDALWFTRFPVGPDEVEIAEVVPFEEAWMRCFKGRRVVTLCPYIYAGISDEARAARLHEIAAVHDRVVDLEALG